MPEATLVDANVLLDVFTQDPRWAPWAEDALAAALDEGPVLIDQIVYGEISVRFSRIEDLDAVLGEAGIGREDLPWGAAFLAAKAHAAYRRRGGRRVTVLPDFLIGAHAALRRHTLLTRDAARFRTAFPGLRIVAPD